MGMGRWMVVSGGCWGLFNCKIVGNKGFFFIGVGVVVVFVAGTIAAGGDALGLVGVTAAVVVVVVVAELFEALVAVFVVVVVVVVVFGDLK
jgi:hypothetical protein